MLDALKKDVWSELYGRKPIDLYRRQLQQLYVKRVHELLHPSQNRPIAVTGDLPETMFSRSSPYLVDVSSTLRAHLVDLQSDINILLDKFVKDVLR